MNVHSYRQVPKIFAPVIYLQQCGTKRGTENRFVDSQIVMARIARIYIPSTSKLAVKLVLPAAFVAMQV